MEAVDEAAFCAYAAAHARAMRRTAFMLCGDWDHADDVTQNVLMKLYRNWTGIDRRDQLDGYVRTMLVHATFERRRRARWHRERSAPQPPDAAIEADPHVEDRVVLLDALARMPARQRAVLVLRFWEDLDVAQTAAILGCAEGTVKSQTARGLTALRALLADPHLTEGPLS